MPAFWRVARPAGTDRELRSVPNSFPRARPTTRTLRLSNRRRFRFLRGESRAPVRGTMPLSHCSARSCPSRAHQVRAPRAGEDDHFGLRSARNRLPAATKPVRSTIPHEHAPSHYHPVPRLLRSSICERPRPRSCGVLAAGSSRGVLAARPAHTGDGDVASTSCGGDAAATR